MSSVQSIYINKTEMYMQVDTYDVLHVHTLPVDAEDNEIEWEIEDTTVVSLNNNIGQLRALRVGESSITIYLKSDHNIFAKCMVHVVERIPVESISFPVPELTMNVNNTMKLGVIVSPTNATNRKVYWSSCCPDIATVDSEGVVRPKSPGQVDIYATTEERNLTAKCTITIEQYVPVKSIRFKDSELTLKKSQTKKLTAIVEPSNATYPQVIWHSCCPDVATVDSSGKITPHSLGSVDIYATTVDGNFTAKCTVRIVIEDVTIQKDELSAEIVFVSTNKTWKCIFADMIYNEDARLNYILNQRVWHNLYVNHPENQNLKTYTDEELKFLYSVDPHGVAIHIESYAAEKYSNLKKRIEYKDRIFKVLFDREPLYFRRISGNEWIKTNDTSNISEVLSESETIFGMHLIWDDISLTQLLSIGIKIAELAIEVFIAIKFPNMSFTNKLIYQTVEDVVKAFVLLTSGVNTIELFELVQDELGDQTFKNTSLAWVNDFVSPVADLYNIIRTKISVSPNLNIKIMKHCASESLYNIKLKLANGDTHNLREVCSIINQL